MDGLVTGKVMTVKGAAEYYGIGVDAVRKRIDRGQLRSFREGRRVMVEVPDKTLQLPGPPAVVSDNLSQIAPELQRLIQPYLDHNANLIERIGALQAELRETKRNLLAAQRVILQLARQESADG